jgi:hypothetical protein
LVCACAVYHSSIFSGNTPPKFIAIRGLGWLSVWPAARSIPLTDIAQPLRIQRPATVRENLSLGIEKFALDRRRFVARDGGTVTGAAFPGFDEGGLLCGRDRAAGEEASEHEEAEAAHESISEKEGFFLVEHPSRHCKSLSAFGKKRWPSSRNTLSRQVAALACAAIHRILRGERRNEE